VKAEAKIVTKAQRNLLGVKARHIDLRSKFSCLDIVNIDSDCSGGRDNILAVLRHVDRTARLVYLEHTNSHQLMSVVHADRTVVRASEEEIAVVVVHDFVHGT